MSIPNDPSIKAPQPVRAIAPQLPDMCPVCLGAGHYLEAFSGDPVRELLPVRCPCCEGSGRRPLK